MHNNRIVLVHEGSIKFNRGLELMLDLFIDEYYRDNIKLKIIGTITGDELKFYKQKIDEYLINEDMIELTGWVDYQELYRYLTGDIGIVFFNKTFNTYYGMPNKLFNYVNAGLPIISTPCAELSDFILNKKIGYIANRDKDSIKEGINELTANYNFYIENIKKIQKTYNWKTEENKLFSLYEKLLGSND